MLIEIRPWWTEDCRYQYHLGWCDGAAHHALCGDSSEWGLDEPESHCPQPPNVCMGCQRVLDENTPDGVDYGSQEAVDTVRQKLREALDAVGEELP